MTLVLAGSSISVMEEKVLGGGSPLYGRRTGAIDLPPVSIERAALPVLDDMSTTSDSSVSFDQANTRTNEIYSTIETWIDDLVAGVDEARASEEFQEWLDVQSRFHDYSYRNTLLIKRQCPGATKVAGYRAWQQKFNRYVREGE